MHDRGPVVCVKGSESVDSGGGGDGGSGGGGGGGYGRDGRDGGGGIYVTTHPNHLLFIIIACVRARVCGVFVCMCV